MLTNDENNGFLELLAQIPVRISNIRACDKFSELEENELSCICSLSTINTVEEACGILKPIYQKYKCSSGKRRMPELVIRSIYFIIYREMTQKLLDDKARPYQERTLLDENGKLRKRIKIGCTNKVYRLLDEQSSKAQERLGITPLKDFTTLNYEPLGLHGFHLKDKLFRELFRNVIYQTDYAMFIDLTGEDSVLGDIYYCDREVLLCRDSVTANFYYALKLKYKELCKRARKMIEKASENVRGTIDIYRETLESANKITIEELSNKDDYYKELSEKGRVTTYPLKVEQIDLNLAVMYLAVKLDSHFHSLTKALLQEKMEKILQGEMHLLKNRLEKTIISWGSIEDTLAKIKTGNVSFQVLANKNKKEQLIYIPNLAKLETRKWTYFENMDDTIEREKIEKEKALRFRGGSEEECQSEIKKYIKNKEKRVKKGFLFFDFNVRKDAREAEAVAQFIKENDCLWAFVCDRKYSYWAERLKEEKVSVIEVNREHPYAQYLRLIGYHDVMIITNVEVKGIMFNRLKPLLCAFKINDDELSNVIRVDDGRVKHILDGDEDE